MRRGQCLHQIVVGKGGSDTCVCQQKIVPFLYSVCVHRFSEHATFGSVGVGLGKVDF